MIRLELVTKIYPGQKNPVVNELSLEVPAGEVCILLGPSGCGKTTTLKMINRLVEPTSGEIYINGRNNQDLDPIKLRLNIGYVIQEVGLFPHMTIAENIATVPREKKWPEEKIRARVHEMLRLVGLEPDLYGGRKPAALSGGQRQRVGVARALAADPPILLMDEPFGAVDPITRAHLQNEFLRIQEKMRKTVVFVTHDIDEAIKMGDKIAVMREGKLVQYDPPERLLTAPRDDFVERLVGHNRTLKRLHLIQVKEVVRKEVPVVSPESSLEDVARVSSQSKIRAAFVVDPHRRLLGVVPINKLNHWNGSARAGDVLERLHNIVEAKATLNDALSVMLNCGEWYVAVLNNNTEFEGIVTLGNLLELMKEDAA
ncbi:MAG: betaine/proline/choline family ABC transporter ATP-binding protein [Bacillota bacterium]|nr:betaine/proline/choline family ABC transporter ATP-binding protein [Bacillota bacterium]